MDTTKKDSKQEGEKQYLLAFIKIGHPKPAKI